MLPRHRPKPPAGDHDAFLAILPRIRGYGRRAFRYMTPVDREEATAEAVAIAWRAFVTLRGRGRDPTGFPLTLARFSALAVLEGRRVGGPMASQDVMSVARRRAGLRVSALADEGGGDHPSAAAVLPGGATTRVPDAAAFRIDFPAWLDRLTRVRRRVALLLAAGFGTGEVAAGTGVTAGRVSQLRRELAADWHRFHAGRPPVGGGR